MKKKIISVLLAVVMLFAIMPAIDMQIDSSATDNNNNLYIGNNQVGDIIEFGNYPQSEVTDAELIGALNNIEKTWVSYNYYSSNGSVENATTSDYMKYADISLDDEKYRAVKFTKYRPWDASKTATEDYSNLIDNGYYINTIYYFKYEPIKWRVLDPDAGFVVSEYLLDSQAYTNLVYWKEYSSGSIRYYNNTEMTVKANDYATSSIRKWLNDEFLNTAFSAEEQNNILLEEIDNSSYQEYTYPFKAHSSDNTTDKIYLLSALDMKNENYGFSDSDATRIAYGTDYAKVQGLDVLSNNASVWYSRSAVYDYSTYCGAWASTHLGSLISFGDIDGTGNGVRPAMKLSHEHNWNEGSISTLATCIATGVKTYTCSTCNATKTETISKLGHDMGDWSVTTSATCTTVGEERSDCSRCDYYETREIAISDHEDIDNDGHCDDCTENICEHTNTSLVNVKSETCTETGYTGDTVCDKCGDTITTGTVINPLNHDMSEWTVTTPATCENVGEERSDCSRCDYYETREITIKAHEDTDNDGHCDDCTENICEHTNTSLVNVKSETCTETGYTGDTVCDKCGDTITTGTVINPLNHDMGEWAVTTPATCESVGEEQRDCSRCDYYETREIAIKAHEDTDNDGLCDDCTENICEHENTSLVNTKSATCTENGYTGDTVCDKCGDTTATGTIINPLNHNMGAWTVTTPATCESVGEEQRDCSRCDYYETREIAIKAHEDTDNDGHCDDCKDNIFDSSEDVPSIGDDTNNDEATNNKGHICFCACHCDNPFISFFYKIIRFLRMLFGLNYCRYCDCPYV